MREYTSPWEAALLVTHEYLSVGKLESTGDYSISASIGARLNTNPTLTNWVCSAGCLVNHQIRAMPIAGGSSRSEAFQNLQKVCDSIYYEHFGRFLGLTGGALVKSVSRDANQNFLEVPATIPDSCYSNEGF